MIHAIDTIAPWNLFIFRRHFVGENDANVPTKPWFYWSRGIQLDVLITRRSCGSNPISATSKVLRIHQGSEDFFLFCMDLWYIGLLSCLVDFSMIYLGGKWAAKGKGDRSSARRRRAVGKKVVKRAFSILLTLKCEKTIVFAKNLRFAKSLFRK